MFDRFVHESCLIVDFRCDSRFFRYEISVVVFFDGSDQDYFKICSSRLPHWLSHRLLPWRAKASEVVTVNMAPKRLRRKKRLRSGKEELLFKVGLPNQSVRKAKKQRTGNSCAMGTTEWFKMLEQFCTGPETLQEYFMSHIDPLHGCHGVQWDGHAGFNSRFGPWQHGGTPVRPAACHVVCVFICVLCVFHVRCVFI